MTSIPLNQAITLTSEIRGKIKSALEHYLKQDFVLITDFDKVVDNSTVEEGIITCPCPCQTIYLDNTYHAVTHGNQHVVKLFFDENDELIEDDNGIPVDCDETGDDYARAERSYYYDFNPNIEGIAGTYEYINTLEWIRSENIWE